MAIRRVRPADVDAILDLDERALRAQGAYIETAPDGDLREPRSAYVDRGGEFLVGELAGKVVATGAYRPAPGWVSETVGDVAEPAGQLKRMRVAPDRQGEGLGTDILRELETRARRDGFREVLLDTDTDWFGTRAFYEARGFDHATSILLDLGDRQFDLALYRKRLDRD